MALPRFLYKPNFNTALLGAVFVVILDRFAKGLALRIWSVEPVVVIKHMLSLGFHKNFFVAFSIDPLADPIIISGTILLLLAAYFFWSIRKRRLDEAACLAFIILGAASNLHDRLAYGYVIDYIDLSYFTVFNLADAMITFGVAVLMLRQFAPSRRV